MTWHPRQSAYPIAWQMRNGRWGEVFAEIRQRHVRGRMSSVVEFVLFEAGVEVGAYPHGDDAAMVAWVRYLERSRHAGAESTVVDAEIAHRVMDDGKPRAATRK